MFRRNPTNQSHQRNNSDWNVRENSDACYECGRTGHIKKYCPQLRNKTANSNSRDFKEKKFKSRKALLTWDDSDESDKEGSEDEDVAQLCFMANDDDPKHNDIWLWHRRLGHVHMDLIKKLLSKDLVRGLPNLREFEMSMMGELTFFLGLQIKQSKEGIFINQSKYTRELLKRFGLENAKPRGTPISPSVNLIKDENGKDVDSKLFRGLWYPRNSSIDLVGFSDSDYAGCLVDRTIRPPGEFGGLRTNMVDWELKMERLSLLEEYGGLRINIVHWKLHMERLRHFGKLGGLRTNIVDSKLHIRRLGLLKNSGDCERTWSTGNSTWNEAFWRTRWITNKHSRLRTQHRTVRPSGEFGLRARGSGIGGRGLGFGVRVSGFEFLGSGGLGSGRGPGFRGFGGPGFGGSGVRVPGSRGPGLRGPGFRGSGDPGSGVRGPGFWGPGFRGFRVPGSGFGFRVRGWGWGLGLGALGLRGLGFGVWG
ncbi:hypothetical protein RJ640_010431 [Escallonia rubra]|uniref:CCHC-type domain-containing protein n=1 Tax=Escallonia rubra TaxID=112253 RepID=A0AA88UPE2_9ASTE|nr:hypothetical protein RJ640_010431 [Escallonia rubra]